MPRIWTAEEKQILLDANGKKNESVFSPKDLAESLRLNRAEMMRKRISQNRDLWTGLPLPEEILIEINECGFFLVRSENVEILYWRRYD
jgi:hypothetical protein